MIERINKSASGESGGCTVGCGCCYLTDGFGAAVACGEDSASVYFALLGAFGHASLACHDVAVVVQADGVLKRLVFGDLSDSDEHSVNEKLGFRACHRVGNYYAAKLLTVRDNSLNNSPVKNSRFWTMVTCSQFSENITASTSAEFPPPITATLLPR